MKELNRQAVVTTRVSDCKRYCDIECSFLTFVGLPYPYCALFSKDLLDENKNKYFRCKECLEQFKGDK